MLRDKKIVLKYTPAARALEALCFLLILALLYLAVTMYQSAPEDIPKSFDAMGAPVQWMTKETALLPPILAVFIYIIATGIGVILRRAAARNEPGGTLAAMLMIILCVKAVYLAYAIIRTYFAMGAERLPFWTSFVLPVGFGVTIAAGAWSIWRRRRKPEK